MKNDLNQNHVQNLKMIKNVVSACIYNPKHIKRWACPRGHFVRIPHEAVKGPRPSGRRTPLQNKGCRDDTECIISSWHVLDGQRWSKVRTYQSATFQWHFYMAKCCNLMCTNARSSVAVYLLATAGTIICSADKVVCVFPMAIRSKFRTKQNRDDDHREDAPHYIRGNK